ncbi:hypothetical protein VTO42DRAFT_2217 [Malbranchea cinnamomea]
MSTTTVKPEPNHKPILLYVGHPIQYETSRWAKLQTSFTILPYTKGLSKPELISAFRPGGAYSSIDGILRPNSSDIDLPRLDKELVAALPPTCKIIASANHGYDGEDTDELARRGIWYCNGAGGADDSTADTGLYLIISAFRHTTLCEHRLRTLRKGDFFSVEKEAVEISRNPRGHILGIVGLGQIGRAVAARALAIGMKIHYFGRRRKSAELEAALGGAVFHEALDSMLKVADCVLLACPHTPETHHILDHNAFHSMKRGVRIVNIGRGKCIDEEALADAIDAGIVAGAGLDVYHDEPTINPRLLDNWKITLLPHIGGGTKDTKANFERIVLDNIEAFFLGDGMPLTPVNQIGTTAAAAAAAGDSQN